MTALLAIEDLHVAVAGSPVLRGIGLEIGAGEVHAIMGPNGSGKTTLAAALAGRADCEIVRGRALFGGRDLFTMEPEERALAGLFLGFQHPVDVPGVGVMTFLRAALNARRRARGEEEINPADFLRLVRRHAARLEIGEDMLRREVNAGFSGGEKKRFEMLQMSVLQPKLAVLDEIDSGLDIDALRMVAAQVRERDGAQALLLITHYRRLLDHIEPDRVHVLSGGRIARSGGAELAGELERTGYAAASAA